MNSAVFNKKYQITRFQNTPWVNIFPYYEQILHIEPGVTYIEIGSGIYVSPKSVEYAGQIFDDIYEIQ